MKKLNELTRAQPALANWILMSFLTKMCVCSQCLYALKLAEPFSPALCSIQLYLLNCVSSLPSVIPFFDIHMLLLLPSLK